MFILAKAYQFEASHVLPSHDGKCSQLHGHSYTFVVKVRGLDLRPNGPKEGMLMDFGDISKVVKPLIVNYLDHRHLNDSLEMHSPTAELIAEWIFNQLYSKIPGLHSVAVRETDTSEATFEP
jgi:6-pyruvoyltetrahydropterin/6-carboxytetrahydropterin synthase